MLGPLFKDALRVPWFKSSFRAAWRLRQDSEQPGPGPESTFTLAIAGLRMSWTLGVVKLKFRVDDGPSPSSCNRLFPGFPADLLVLAARPTTFPRFLRGASRGALVSTLVPAVCVYRAARARNTHVFASRALSSPCAGDKELHRTVPYDYDSECVSRTFLQTETEWGIRRGEEVQQGRGSPGGGGSSS